MDSNNLYIYKAKYIKNYDGDTVTFLVDLGMGTYRKENVRLYGIDTEELRSSDPEKKELAYQAKMRTEFFLMGEEIYIKTYRDKTGKYGRYLAEVFVEGREESLNEILIKEGLAKPYN